MSRPKPPAYRTANWHDYNAALARRRSLAIWFDPETPWLSAPSGKRGRQAVFSDAAIQACLTLKAFFGLAVACKLTLLWCLMLCLAGPVVAEDQKLGLLPGLEADASFAFDADAIDFSSKSPSGFLWNASAAVPGEFVDTALFTSLEERFIGYEPLNRDRFEIRIYAAKIVPERVALAADYGRLFASQWGPANFGVMAHSPDFAEVLGGDDKSGAMRVNRISVFRRGDSLLVIRAIFAADHFATVALPLAGFIGSATFRELEPVNRVRAAFVSDAVPATGVGEPFRYQVPGNWARLEIAPPPADQGQFQFWTDTSDPAKDTALMVGRVVLPKGPRIDPANPDPQAMADLASMMANVMAKTLLDAPDLKLEPVERTAVPELRDVTGAHGHFSFRARVQPGDKDIILAVMLSLGEDGTMLVSGTIAPAPLNQYRLGSFMHANMLMKLQVDAQSAFWRQE